MIYSAYGLSGGVSFQLANYATAGSNLLLQLAYKNWDLNKVNVTSVAMSFANNPFASFAASGLEWSYEYKFQNSTVFGNKDSKTFMFEGVVGGATTAASSYWLNGFKLNATSPITYQLGAGFWSGAAGNFLSNTADLSKSNYER